MARWLSASVLLVHVTPLPPPVSVGAGTIELGDVETTKQIFARVRDLAPHDLQVNECVRQGSAADEIVRTAQDWRADLIVMGTHGCGRVPRLLLGSVAATVVRCAPCPVVTVAHDPVQAGWCIEETDDTGNVSRLDVQPTMMEA